METGNEFAADLIPVESNDWREPFRLLFKEEWFGLGMALFSCPNNLKSRNRSRLISAELTMCSVARIRRAEPRRKLL